MREYYESGNPKAFFTYRFGKRTGIGETYHPNGQLRTKQEYNLGIPGEGSSYNERGELIKHEEIQ